MYTLTKSLGGWVLSDSKSKTVGFIYDKEIASKILDFLNGIKNIVVNTLIEQTGIDHLYYDVCDEEIFVTFKDDNAVMKNVDDWYATAEAVQQKLPEGWEIVTVSNRGFKIAMAQNTSKVKHS